MVVNSPREFPLTRENVILIRQSFLTIFKYIKFLISNLLPKIYCHFIIARPGNENLVALQPTVSGIFETLKLLRFFQEISADQSVTSVSPEDRRCLFPEVLKCNLKLSKCFVSFRRGN